MGAAAQIGRPWRTKAALRFRETAQILSISERKLYQDARDEKIPTVTVLGCRRIPTSWVREQLGEPVEPVERSIPSKVEDQVDDFARELGV